MHQTKSKKIIFYFFLFILLGTTHNLYLNKFEHPKVNRIHILGLNEQEKNEILKDLNFLNIQNLYFLDTLRIEKILLTNSFIETFSIFRKFPSTLEINIKKTQILANMYIDGSNFLIGSNAKLIKSKEENKKIPTVFGNFETSDFLEFKKIIDESSFSYKDIDSIYYFSSKRWDIKLKNNILIKLPIEKNKDALELAFELIRSKKFKDIKIIDTRLDNQIILNE